MSELAGAGRPLRVVIFSGAEPALISRLACRIAAEGGRAQVCGIVRETPASKSLPQRARKFLAQLRQPDYVAYVAERLAGSAKALALRCGEQLLRVVHAGRPPRGPAPELRAAVHVTADLHSAETLRWVRALEPDLGLVYGTGILKPALFAIPRLGSINVHKRRLPDYRGGGPVGLWELLDGCTEIGVSVHQVTEKLDAGAILASATIPIERFDTLTSLALKAHVVGNDLLVQSVADLASGAARPQPQPSGGRLYRSPRPQRLARYLRDLQGSRDAYIPPRSRPALKLLARTLLALPVALVRNWSRRLRGDCSVTILFHHLVTDRPHPLGIPTELFYRHVQYLSRHYQIVSLTQALDMLRNRTVDRPTVVLTLDDGYADNYLSLRAIREQLPVPITLFVASAHLGSQQPFAHDLAYGRPGFLPLTWTQVERLDREGVEIGSHTRTHFDCGSRVVADLEREIVGSKRELEQHLGHPVRFFSFPFGLRQNMSPPALERARSAYDCVCSAYGGSNRAVDGDLRELRRCSHVNDMWELELQLQGFLELTENRTGVPLPSPPDTALPSTAPV